ncbi:Beta-barrel assembly machine subunit BamF [Celeribacter neptunius]|uniref:Beta-barrel assembly machine subunit BamF n=1 Tax=Celeribacter neptunius TaxID=588602 RepID=A0A1I3RXE6_9RHOB|nr:Beta-barrel assembly machine subunit BamF [Celeribacter neptunius]
MVSNVLRTGVCLLALGALVACGQSGPRTPNRVKTGPDEFSIVPGKPLQEPANYTDLPAPTPGGANLTDATPKADAIVALGGRVPTGGVDGGIVSYASRYGVDPAIRADLSKADEGRRTGRGSYERAYKRFALDAYEEWLRLRAMGVTVPSAPAE